LLLVFTFIFGTGAAFIAPAWQAIVPKLVPREELSSAIALNSMGINISRAIGPALAGFLIVGAGLASPFLVNALSVVGIVAALWWWSSERTTSTLPPEHIGGAIRAGLRYAVYSGPLKATLVRAAAFFLFASAFWAMLPLIAREVLSGGATLYGILLTSVGAGAVVGAFLLPTIKKRLGADSLVAAGTVGTATVLLIMATVGNQVIAVAATALAGLSWIAVLSSLNVSAQTSLPDWVRARGLSIFLTVFFGSMSLGSLLWGQVASIWTIPVALIIAAVGALALIPLTWRTRLGQGEALDLTPSMHWPEPVLATDAAPDGPVMIQVTYQVAAPNHQAFQSLMPALANSRRQGVGYRWGLMNDAADPERFVETWWEASWLDHQRHHVRVTKDSRKLQERIKALQSASTEPIVRHFVMPTALGF
ncbi:MAG: MFS transporter, partial [Pseudomonadota bacterium]